MKRNLQTVSQFAAESPFSEAQLRWLIFRSRTNGLASAGAVVRIGRRVYLDVRALDRWIDGQNPAATTDDRR